VHDVLFPYALKTLPDVLTTEWDSPSFTPYRDAFPPEHRSTPDALLAHVKYLMSWDVKVAYLKNIQGYLWKRGYANGLVCTLFPDVPAAMKLWSSLSIKTIIYSSGSIAAQQDLFAHTDQGDLRGLIEDYFDTTNAGLKQEKTSYEKIWEKHKGLGEKKNWLFLTDRVVEVRAAREAGLLSWLIWREGNVLLTDEDKHGQKIIDSFDEVPVPVGWNGEERGR